MRSVHADLRNPAYVRWRRFLAEAEDWTPQQIADRQLADLRRVVTDAYTHCAGYRSLYDEAGVSPADLHSPDDLSRFPTVTKEMVRASLEDFSIPMDRRAYVTTGGSTGVPLGLYRDPDAFPRELASKAHQYARLGWREGDPQFVLRGLALDTADHTELVDDFNELRCSSYHLVPEWMEQFRQKALAYRPDWLRCYPSSGHIFAAFLADTRRELPPLKGVLCASENLYDGQKALLARVFGARVFSHYGHYELAALAGFCEVTDRYHVLPQYGFVELLDPAGGRVRQPGARGEIVATSFINRGTPLVRYRTGDLAVYQAASCPGCGRPYEIWDRVEGRLQEFIVTSTGRYISMTGLNAHDLTFEEVRQFQFRQERPGEITLQCVPLGDWTPEVANGIAARLAPKLGGDIRVTIVPVKEIPMTARGKHRFLVQQLPLALGDA